MDLVLFIEFKSYEMSYRILANLRCCTAPCVCIYIYVTGTKTGSEMRQRKAELNHTFVTNSYLAWMPAGVQTNLGGSSAYVQWFSHQNGGADDHDIII